MRILLLTLGLSGILAATPATAGLVAQATLTSAPDVDGTDFDYTIVLKNTTASDNTIGTFWFAWVPGEDFMLNMPISTTNPSGWVAALTHAPNIATNGWAIQWKASSSASYIQVGSSLTFAFKSAETPDQIAGLSPYWDNPPETRSFVYNQAPFSAVSEQFDVTVATPEPTTILSAALGAVGFGLIVYRRKHAQTKN